MHFFDKRVATVPGAPVLHPDAFPADYRKIQERIGTQRCVVVTPSAYGTNNQVTLDGMAAMGPNARGVAVVDTSVSDDELQRLHKLGVRGVRFNFVRRLADPKPDEYYLGLAEAVAEFGWHIVVYFEAPDLAERWQLFTSLPTVVVVDHMGRPDVSQPVDGPDFARFTRFMHENENVWSKVSGAERLSVSGPPGYADVVPFARHIVETFPDRVIWGTDWPHPNMRSHMPDDGNLVDLIPRIAPTEDRQRRLLVANPMRLYWEAGT